MLPEAVHHPSVLQQIQLELSHLHSGRQMVALQYLSVVTVHASILYSASVTCYSNCTEPHLKI